MSDSTFIEYRGNCHCAAFKFTFKAPEIKETYACNCSICYKTGYLWGFPPEGIVVVKGDVDSTLKSYEFGNRTMQHKFCPTCGTSVLARTSDGKIGVNLRTLDKFDAAVLPVAATSDGAAKEPHYQVPQPVDVGLVPEGTTVYQGSCHCGAVRYAHLASEPLAEAYPCNCSACHRDAAVWVYPDIPTVTFSSTSLSSLTEYTFGPRRWYHGFCGVCGVSIRERFVDTSSEFESDRDGTRTDALNVRTMQGVKLEQLKLTMSDGRGDVPEYDAGW